MKKHPGDPKAQLREMGLAYVHFFVRNPEYLRLLFLSDISLRAHFGHIPEVQEQYDSFQFLQTVTADYVNATPDAPFTQNELMIYSWGLVHGQSPPCSATRELQTMMTRSKPLISSSAAFL